MDAERRVAALERFERAVEVPLLVAALALVPLLTAPVLFDLSSASETMLEVADWVIWAAFAGEYVVRLALAPKRSEFVRRAWIDLAFVVVPFLRPLRLARSARVLRGLRLVRLAALVGRWGRQVRRFFVRHRLHHALAAEAGLLVVAAALVLRVERNDAADGIATFGEALWWAFTTMTTGVGYGAAVPATFLGHLIGIVLMLAGIALFGVLTANVAAFFVASEQDDRLGEVLRRLDAIEAAVRRDR